MDDSRKELVKRLSKDILKPSFDNGISEMIEDAPPMLSDRSGVWSNKAKERKYIFISYSHLDAGKVYADLNKLWSINANYWYDKEFVTAKTSESWAESAKRIIHDENCVGILFYISKDSFVSDAVYHEVKCALEARDKKKDFYIKSVFIDCNSLFDLQIDPAIKEKFNSEKLIAYHTLFGTDILHAKYYLNGKHFFEIANWFIKLDCVNDMLFDTFDSVIVRDNCIIVGDMLLSYFGMDKEFDFKGNEKIRVISQKAFSSPLLEVINIPNGVEEIEDFSIVACTNLKTIKLPSTVERMSYFALSNFSFEKIEIDKNNKNYATDEFGFVYKLDKEGNHISLFASPNHNNVDILRMENTVIAINDFAISCCLFLKEIYFSKNLRRIGYWALKGNPNLKTIHLFPGIEYISPKAFEETSIETVVFHGTQKQWKSNKKINNSSTLSSLFSKSKILLIDEL